MVGFIARIFLIIAGFFASFFVAKDELLFPIIQMVICVILFTALVAFLAFLPEIRRWWQRPRQK